MVLKYVLRTAREISPNEFSPCGPLFGAQELHLTARRNLPPAHQISRSHSSRSFPSVVSFSPARRVLPCPQSSPGAPGCRTRAPPRPTDGSVADPRRSVFQPWGGGVRGPTGPGWFHASSWNPPGIGPIGPPLPALLGLADCRDNFKMS